MDVSRQRLWNIEAAPVGIGDMSFEHGGPMAPHNSHQDGRCVDIRPLRSDKRNSPVTISDAHYDRESTRALVVALLAHGNVCKILFNDHQISGVIPWAGHDNHFHVIMKS
jgi:conjugal transfer mating pair stabilization protein TraG